MKCPFCGKHLPEGSTSCEYCGAKLNQKLASETPWDQDSGVRNRFEKEGPSFNIVPVIVICVLVIGGLVLGLHYFSEMTDPSKQAAKSSSVISELSETVSATAEDTASGTISAEYGEQDTLSDAAQKYVDKVAKKMKAIRSAYADDEYTTVALTDTVKAFMDEDENVYLAKDKSSSSDYDKTFFYNDKGTMICARYTNDSDEISYYFKNKKLVCAVEEQDGFVTTYEDADDLEDMESEVWKAGGNIPDYVESYIEQETKKKEADAKKKAEAKAIREAAEKEAAEGYVLNDPIEEDDTEEETKDDTKDDTSTAKSGDYVLPKSNSKYYTKDDLKDMSSDQLRMARNEIYARHGYQFEDDTLQKYFEGKSWYKASNDFKYSDLNDYEIKNLELIKSLE